MQPVQPVYQGMCHLCHTGSDVTREKVLQTLGVRTRQTNQGGARPSAHSVSVSSQWQYRGEILAIFELRIEFLSLFVISGLKLTDCSSLPSPLRVSPEYHCQSAAACFPYLSKSGPKYPALSICQTRDTGCDKRVQCPAYYFILTTGATWAVVLNCDHTSGGDDPGVTTDQHLQYCQDIGYSASDNNSHISQQSLLLRDHHGMLHNPQ